MAIYREQQIKWNHKLKLLAAISPPQVKWPKTRDVSWETLPELILQLDKDGMLPPQLKTTDVDVWDPCFFNGNVKNTWRRVGISIRHSCVELSSLRTHPSIKYGWSHSLSFLRPSITHFSSCSTIKLLTDFTSADICLIELDERESWKFIISRNCIKWSKRGAGQLDLLVWQSAATFRSIGCSRLTRANMNEWFQSVHSTELTKYLKPKH